MTIENFMAELKASLRSYDKRGIIDDASVYLWVETALKKFGADITMPKETMLDVHKGYASVPGDYYDLILAFKCDFNKCDIKEKDDKIVAELQNTYMWKEISERTHRWCSCNECCKEEQESTVVEKIYINVRDRDCEVDMCYNKPVPLKLAKPMLKDMCLSDCRNKMVKESEYEINIVNGGLYANFDGPVYFKYKALPFDDKGNIFIPDTPLGLLASYVENYVKMRLFEEWMLNGEVPGAADIYKLYMQQDLVKLRDAKTEVKMAQLSIDGMKKLKNRGIYGIRSYEIMSPVIDGVIKFI